LLSPELGLLVLVLLLVPLLVLFVLALLLPW
jgi:hypothetical protein